ncbi:MAG TPA: molybdate ABC transporter substrate-binding protein [Methyloceanibacter sp.]|nr:molybdate ABC transporter substrate-binding protein [Methyloceanibacter sp.]
MKLGLLGLATLLGSALFGMQAARAQDVPVVAAASDLQFALHEVAAAFTKETKRVVNLTFGSSGNFYRQIQQGAPFQIFLSADEQLIFDLAAERLTVDEGALYAVGRIVIIAPKGSALEVVADLAGLKAALADGRVRKFAIANPEHAPYGRRAEEALRHAGLWEAIKDKLVFGENVSQAAQFATSGATQGGIIAYSLALSPEVSKLGTYALIPDDWHEPLRQRMALIKGAGETARLFFAFMQGPSARAIMGRYGFVLPGESS